MIGIHKDMIRTINESSRLNIDEYRGSKILYGITCAFIFDEDIESVYKDKLKEYRNAVEIYKSKLRSRRNNNFDGKVKIAIDIEEYKKTLRYYHRLVVLIEHRLWELKKFNFNHKEFYT